MTLQPTESEPFLRELEEKRGCGGATRNQRLAAIHSLAFFIGMHSQSMSSACGEIRTILSKKVARSLVTYLEKQ